MVVWRAAPPSKPTPQPAIDLGGRIELGVDATAEDLFDAIRARGASSGADACHLVFPEDAALLPTLEIMVGEEIARAGWTCDDDDLEPVTRSRGVKTTIQYGAVAMERVYARRGGFTVGFHRLYTGSGGSPLKVLEGLDPAATRILTIAIEPAPLEPWPELPTACDLPYSVGELEVAEVLQALVERPADCIREHDLTGYLTVRFTIATDGQTRGIDVDSNLDAELARCVRTVIERAEFPAACTATPVTWPAIVETE